MSSMLMTREQNDIENTVIIRPQTRVASSLHARWLALLGKVGLIKNKYATFGIEKSPVEFSDLQLALVSRKPTAFIFYWVSYFVSFKCMFELRQAYPNIPFVFICLDEAFLTGGCHYTWECHGYESTCSNCPSTLLSLRKKRIEQELRQRVALVRAINPIVLYPTTNLQQMGKESVVLKDLRSAVIPLGAVSIREKSHSLGVKVRKNKLTLLIRSSSEYRKGCDLFVDAIKAISAKVSDIRSRLEVISIGDATLKDAKIGDYVDHSCLGFVERDELMAIYEKVDALLVTSREDGGPIMINEFVALEKFVITTPVGVADDLITDKKNGLIVRQFTSEAIGDALFFLFDNPELYDCQCSCAPASGIDSSRLTFEGYIRIMMDKTQIMPANDE